MKNEVEKAQQDSKFEGIFVIFFLFFFLTSKKIKSRLSVCDT